MYRHQRKDGISFVVEISTNGAVIGGQKLVFCVCRDVTERKQAEEDIRTINKQLQKVNAEKDKLFSIIAHDLKSPMAGVCATSKILAQEAEVLSRKDISIISAEMHKSTENALDLLNDLMQWARISQGGMDFSPEECSLDELARSSLYTAQDVAKKKGITISCNVPQDIEVLADQPMINAVIRNITFNSVKFTNPDGNISVTARKAGSNVEVCVQDDGIGMDEAIISKIFSIDKSKSQYGTNGEKGTGLGLILCKEFVEKHGGKIWVESGPGKGTKVFFTLPTAT
ncbi:PAS domain-containing sensor histidine kinase [Desulfonatronovibrio magnus]|uniref:PAS domain-containing sensor histidine kinase n=1 Tax=Desulfonatronovibrio magnus TaxID=698827 RepID=UPI0022B65997|nr:PAS domain-containing sensor histidine kinase [Desulfonatronovibrio magnus]